jgi:hypothetical protein
MEFNEATAAQDRADSFLFATVFIVLASVLVAALAAGGRDVIAASGIAPQATTLRAP